jgi:hypothetical protein
MREPDEHTTVVRLDAEREHGLRNQFGVILGYCEAIVHDLAPGEPARADVLEIQKAAAAALQLIADARVGK